MVATAQLRGASMADGESQDGEAHISLKAAGTAVMASAALEKGGAPPSSVMVAVRVRPQNAREISQGEANCIEVGSDGFCAISKPDEEGKKYQFSFDYSYGDDTEQLAVYENLGAPILTKAFQGWNGTIFAYGQTGSGKSFSMTGTSDKRGIIPQMNNDMFDQIAAISAAEPERKFLVTCSFMEIYNEVRPRARMAAVALVRARGAGSCSRGCHGAPIKPRTVRPAHARGARSPPSPAAARARRVAQVLYDLLDPSMKKGTSKDRKTTHLDIHEHPTLGVYVAGLQELAVDSAEKIQGLMDQGNEMRAVAATNMNATSSRSHSIFIIRLLQKEVIAGQQKDTRATINLVDLAGSERQAKTGAVGDKLKEGANINKSLSALGNVINALAEQCKNPKKKARAGRWPAAAGGRARQRKTAARAQPLPPACGAQHRAQRSPTHAPRALRTRLAPLPTRARRSSSRTAIQS